MDTRALDKICARFVARLRRMQVQAGLARALLVGVALLPVVFFLDWWIHLATAYRFVLLAGWLATVGAVAWCTLWRPLRKRWTTEEVLNYLDRTAPAGEAGLMELYELIGARDQIQEIDSATGAALVDDAVAQLEPRLKAWNLGGSFEGRRLARWMMAAALVVALLGGVCLTTGGREHLAIGAARFFNPLSRVRWPHLTTITVAQPDTGWKIPQLETFGTAAEITGQIPPDVTLAYKSASGGFWIRDRLTVRRDEASGRVEIKFPEVREPITFYIEGGDYRTDEYQIDIVERPFVKAITAHYRYPKYAGMPDRSQQGGQLMGLEGTEVRLVFDMSMPLKDAKFVLNGGEGESLRDTSGDGTIFEKTMLLSEDGEYTIKLFEQNGFTEAKPEVYEIRVMPDQPPEVEILAPAQNLTLTKNASVSVDFRARDDYGLQKVAFMSQVDNGEPVEVSDRVTGPVPQNGKASAARFTWDLRKLELPERGAIKYFVRVQDVNPTGKGKVDSPSFQIKLVRPSEFHRDAVFRAKILLTEARNAWRSQKSAWQRGGEFLAKGTGNENDPVWVELNDEQGKAVRAVQAIDMHLRTLTEQYERNSMAREFMAGRLRAIGNYVTELTGAHHPAIEGGLRRTKPRTDAEAAPDALKQTRRAALSKKDDKKLTLVDHQKLSLLMLERVLRHLYDWEDLQSTIIATTLLHEDQNEILGTSNALGKRLFGEDILDLSDEDQDTLLTLGKKQRVLFDAESKLEEQLSFLMYRAEKTDRKSIRDPLSKAFRTLRDKRVNHHLKQAAEMIEKNQVSAITKDQETALQALAVVKAGLEVAGQASEPEPAITLAMEPSKRESFDVAQEETPKKETPKEAPATAQGEDGGAPSIEDILNDLPPGEDAVSVAVQIVYEWLDGVLSRVAYLEKQRAQKPIPRFVVLKLGRLQERQADGRLALDKAIEAAKDAPPPVREALAEVARAFDQSKALMQARDTSAGAQQIQKDTRQLLADLLQYISRRKKMIDFAERNRQNDGKDAFDRAFLFRDANLDAALAVADKLNHAHLLSGEAAREFARFGSHPATDGARGNIEKQNREAADLRLAQAGDLGKALVAKLGEFKAPQVGEDELAEDLEEKLKAAGLAEVLALDWAEVAKTAAEDPKKAGEALAQATNALAQALKNLPEILESRVQPKPKEEAVAQADAPEADQRISVEEFEKQRAPETLAARIKNAQNLPPEVRERMIRALNRKFDPRYEKLLSAYYASFVIVEEK